MRKSQLVYLIAQISLAIFNWLILAIIAKKFDKALVGNYSLVLAWLTPIFLLFSLQIKNRILTSVSDKYEELINLRFHLIVPLTFICALVSLTSVPSKLLLGIFLIKLGEYIFEMPFVVDQKSDQLLRGSLIQLLRNFIVYSLIILLAYFDFAFVNALLIGGVCSVALGVLYSISKKLSISWRVDLKSLQSLLPLGISAFLLSFSVSLPRIYLKSLEGLDQVAVYTVVFSFYAIWQMLFNNYFTGILNKFSEMKLKEYLVLPLSVFLISAAVFTVIDTHLYELLYGQEFKGASDYTTYLLANIFISLFNSLFYYRLLSENNYNSHLWINVVTFILSLLVIYIFIKLWGIKGAFIAQAFIQLVQMSLYRRVMNG